MTALDVCRAALQNKNVCAFLRVIREGETNQSDDAYRMAYGGKLYPPNVHPWLGVTTTEAGHSTAFGAYQFLGTSALETLNALGLTQDFSPEVQDLCAVWTIAFKRKALDAVKAGDLVKACSLLATEWVSLPGLGMKRVQDVFLRYGGSYSEAPQSIQMPEGNAPNALDVPSKPKEAPMPIFLSALLQLIPGLITVFGKNSERAKENAATFNVVSEAVVKAVPGATDLPTAISAMVADPAVKMAAEKAVMADSSVAALVEVGGGVEAARKANADLLIATGDHPWKVLFHPVLIVTALTLPLVYLIVLELVKFMDKVSADVIAQTVGTVIGLVLGGICGFWMGQTYQASRRASDNGGK